MRTATVLLLTALCLWAPGSAEAATLQFDLKIKGTSTTVTGQKFKFTGTGTMTVDDKTGQFSFNASLSNGTTLNGTGVAGLGKNMFANLNFNQGPASGVGVISGKVPASRASFKGKFTVGTPNRLGSPPSGFVHTVGSISGKLAPL